MKFPVVIFSIAVAIAITSTFLDGKVSKLWSESGDIKEAGELLRTFPEKFGEWEVVGNTELEKGVTKTLQCNDYVFGNYVNSRTGEFVEVNLLLGPPGPISLHTPEVCYSVKSFTKIGSRKKVAIAGTGEVKHELWRVEFESTRIDKQITRVYYGWHDGEKFSAATSPLWQFTSKPYLYKVQVACLMPAEGDRDQMDTAKKFLKNFLPLAEEFIQ